MVPVDEDQSGDAHRGADDDAGRRARFEALAMPAVDPLRRYLRRRTDPETAEDVLADTLLVTWRRLEQVPDEPLPWLYAVARHCLANAERSVRRQHRLAARIASVDPPAAASSEPAAGDPELHQALAGLDEDDAELVRLWAWEDLAPAQIAVVLDTTPNAVSIRLHRVRARLRELLDATGGPRKDDAGAGHGGSRDGSTP